MQIGVPKANQHGQSASCPGQLNSSTPSGHFPSDCIPPTHIVDVRHEKFPYVPFKYKLTLCRCCQDSRRKLARDQPGRLTKHRTATTETIPRRKKPTQVKQNRNERDHTYLLRSPNGDVVVETVVRHADTDCRQQTIRMH